eukprot:3745520-Rhodomonas_salina.3
MPDNPNYFAVPQQRTTSAFLFQHDNRMIAALQSALSNQAVSPIMQAQKGTVIDIVEQDSPLAANLRYITGTGPAVQLKYSPLCFLSQFDYSFHTAFPRDLWQIFFCSATGAPHPECIVAQLIDRKCMCWKHLDTDQHHLQTCNQHQAGTWTKVHDQIQNVWSDCADLAHINATSNPSKLPRPDDSDRHADIEIQKRTKTKQAIVGDSSLTHPFISDADDRTTWGKPKANALQDLTDEKNAKYLQWHSNLNYMFLPLVCTTFRAISSDALQLLFYLADQAATKNLEASIMGDKIYDDDDGQYTHAYLGLPLHAFQVTDHLERVQGTRDPGKPEQWRQHLLLPRRELRTATRQTTGTPWRHRRTTTTTQDDQ